ncbi:hypothetical protein J4438_01490 [Candidatus Woesearchaeota archaeon]|nr:hypothetical protein [Candidatus Woesearchaeota archaeon]
MISNNSKSWMPFIFLLILVSFVVIYVFLGDLFVSTRQPVQPSPGCIAVQNNGDQENSIDIVFLPDNFQSVEKFREKTDKMIESFKGTKPYVINMVGMLLYVILQVLKNLLLCVPMIMLL